MHHKSTDRSRTRQVDGKKRFNRILDAILKKDRDPDQSLQVNGDNQLQTEVAKVLAEYDSHSKTLQQDLQTFQNDVRGLASSLDLDHSALNVRECLSLTSWLVRENARKIFPGAVDFIEPPPLDSVTERISEHKRPPPWPPTAASATHYIEIPIYEQLKALAKGIGNLRAALEKFPEFGNIEKRALKYFESDLEYWSSCLEHYKGGFETREVQIYVHDMASELGRQYGDISRCIQQYIACIPAVRSSQQNMMSNLQNLATIATFFSAVTATTIQYSISDNSPDTVSRVVKALWFSSLVLSIATALNSSLAYMWRSATYSSPQLSIPWWLWTWLEQCPLVFLLVSVVAFLAGLGCFVVSTEPHLTSIIVLLCEAVSSFSLAALLVSLAIDKWTSYSRQRKLHTDFDFNQFLGKTANVLPTHLEHTVTGSIGYLSGIPHAFLSIGRRFSQLWPFGFLGNERHSTQELALQAPVETSTRESSPSPALQRWRRAINAAFEPEQEWDLDASPLVDRLHSRLRNITVTGEAIRHEAGAATSGLQFDPNGTSLAICGKYLSMRCKLGSSKKDHLRHYLGQARQVIWTACGEYMLTRTHRAVHVWNLSGEFDRKSITRYETSSFIAGTPNGTNSLPRFISVEGSDMNKLALIDIRGDEQWVEDFDVSIHHADVVPGTSYVLLAVEISHFKGVKPIRASPTRKLMVFNLETRKVEHEVPCHNVQNVTMSSGGQLVIVTYKTQPPPQLWRLHRTAGGMQLSLARQFFPQERVSGTRPVRQIRFSGKGQFLNNDRFILCATTEGEIYFWRRDRAESVHVLDELTSDKDKPIQITCNHARDDFMFATRSQDGTIRIWNAGDTPTSAVGPGTAAGLSSNNFARNEPTPSSILRNMTDPEDVEHIGANGTAPSVNAKSLDDDGIITLDPGVDPTDNPTEEPSRHHTLADDILAGPSTGSVMANETME